ncbi:hypothetical protein BH09VER1_BH09VER1_43800 [soil metagenome]
MGLAEESASTQKGASPYVFPVVYKVVSDPVGDSSFGGKAVPELDVVSVAVVRPKRDTLTVSLTINGDFPKSVANRTYYAVYVDLDDNLETGNCDGIPGADLCLFTQLRPEETEWDTRFLVDGALTQGAMIKTIGAEFNGRTVALTYQSPLFAMLNKFTIVVRTEDKGKKRMDRVPDEGTLRFEQ